MSFQAYIDNIKIKTGKEPEDFKKELIEVGLLNSKFKFGDLVLWLKKITN